MRSTTMNLADEVEELESAESFFEFFKVDYDPELIRHSRIQLLKLFNKNLVTYQEPIEWKEYREALTKAYCLLKRGVIVPLAESSCTTCQSDCESANA